MDQTDEHLLSLLATGLDYHFRQLVALYQQRLYSFALRLAGRPQDAEDIVQETFLRTYHALKGYPVQLTDRSKSPMMKFNDQHRNCHAERSEPKP